MVLDIMFCIKYDKLCVDIVSFMCVSIHRIEGMLLACIYIHVDDDNDTCHNAVKNLLSHAMRPWPIFDTNYNINVIHLHIRWSVEELSDDRGLEFLQWSTYLTEAF